MVANTVHCATHRSCAASMTRRRPPAQERAARSLSTRPSGALSSTTATRQASATMPTSWPRCRVPQSNMQPPFAPSAAIAAKSCERTLRGRCQLQQQSQGGFEMEERLTRGEGKVRGGRQTYSARHLIDLAGSACLSSMICTGRFTQVPAVLQRVTRFEPGLFGHMVTTCEHVPILSARVWRAGGRRGRYPRVTVRRPSRIAKMATYSTP